ncbi:hypothetical protein RYH80_07105 [Halobaculum sp. MBLA0147]|uniref:hypothetical protein n=1 Tax=Halobaculum sp. MBLA0147 TaxID=3079934 RepID=UPI0035231F5A
MVVTLCVVGIVLASGVHYAQTYDEEWPYPTKDALASEYDAYVGETVFLFGQVVSVDADSETLQLVVDTDRGPLRLTATDVRASVEPGGVVQVLGTVASDRSVIVDRVVVVNRSGGAALYKYGVSVLGAALVLGLFFNSWQVRTQPLRLEARDG